MARELSRFAMSWGIGELQLYCDNEPTMLQVLALTQRALGFGLKVTTNTSKPQDHGSNALVEQTVHRVRQMVMTLIYQLEGDLGYVLPILHPLCSWAFRHAAWILTVSFLVVARLHIFSFMAKSLEASAASLVRWLWPTWPTISNRRELQDGRL